MGTNLCWDRLVAELWLSHSLVNSCSFRTLLSLSYLICRAEAVSNAPGCSRDKPKWRENIQSIARKSPVWCRQLEAQDWSGWDPLRRVSLQQLSLQDGVLEWSYAGLFLLLRDLWALIDLRGGRREVEGTVRKASVWWRSQPSLPVRFPNIPSHLGLSRWCLLMKAHSHREGSLSFLLPSGTATSKFPWTDAFPFFLKWLCLRLTTKKFVLISSVDKHISNSCRLLWR